MGKENKDRWLFKCINCGKIVEGAYVRSVIECPFCGSAMHASTPVK